MRRQIAACCASRRLRRSAGSSAPSAARMPGQDRGRISRNLRTICQCSARSAGARSASRAKLAPSVATVSRSRARLAASAAAWPGSSGSATAPSAPLQHEPGQQQPAAQFRDRRRHRQMLPSSADTLDQRQLVRIEVADRPHPRQQQRRSRFPPVGHGRAERPRAERAPRAGSAAEQSSAAAPADRRRRWRAAPRPGSPKTGGRARSCRALTAAPHELAPPWTALALDAVRGEALAGRRQPCRRADVIPLAVMHDRAQAARLLGSVEQPDQREDALGHAVEQAAVQAAGCRRTGRARFRARARRRGRPAGSSK